MKSLLEFEELYTLIVDLIKKNGSFVTLPLDNWISLKRGIGRMTMIFAINYDEPKVTKENKTQFWKKWLKSV